MRCDRCDQPIEPGEAETHSIPGATGGGGTVVLHKNGCTAPPHQIYPERPRC